MSFEKLQSRYILTCDLISTSGIHVGTGVASSSTDSPTILQAGKAFVPGSSLRGALRSTVERIARSLDQQNRHKLCTTFEESPPGGCIAALKPRDRKQYEDLPGRELNRRLSLPPGQADSLHLCAICRLFGSTLMAARLKIRDAVQVQEQVHKPVRRDGVGINRDTETAQKGIKYDYEVIEPACTLRFSMQLENAEPSDFALLCLILGELGRGLEIGGMSARGLGRVEMRGQPSIKYFDDARGLPLATFLTTDYAAAPADFVPGLTTAFQTFFFPEEGQQHAHPGHQ